MHVVNSCNCMQLLFLNCLLVFAAVIYSLSAWEDLVDNDCNDGTKVERGNVGGKGVLEDSFQLFLLLFFI